MDLKAGLLWYIILSGRIILRREGYELSGSSGISGGAECIWCKSGFGKNPKADVSFGRSQKKYKTIHVTGTNGKGSVTAMLASCLQAAGIRTGMYISPHLSSYTERMVIDGQPVSQQQFAETLSVVRDICEFMQGEGDEHPTQFEVLTAAAFLLFQKAGVE